jgi:hypothetical protein
MRHNSLASQGLNPANETLAAQYVDVADMLAMRERTEQRLVHETDPATFHQYRTGYSFANDEKQRPDILCFVTMPAIRLELIELADWLDDDAQVHSCNGDRAFQGFEVFMGACLSALDKRRVDLPMEQDVDVLGRMRAELPEC